MSIKETNTIELMLQSNDVEIFKLAWRKILSDIDFDNEYLDTVLIDDYIADCNLETMFEMIKENLIKTPSNDTQARIDELNHILNNKFIVRTKYDFYQYMYGNECYEYFLNTSKDDELSIFEYLLEDIIMNWLSFPDQPYMSLEPLIVRLSIPTAVDDFQNISSCLTKVKSIYPNARIEYDSFDSNGNAQIVYYININNTDMSFPNWY